METSLNSPKSAVFQGIDQVLLVTEIEVDDPKAGEVLIKSDATGLCHIEIWQMSSGDTTTRANSILGHQGCEDYESCGIVVKVGDGVMAIDIPKCGECREPLGSG